MEIDEGEEWRREGSVYKASRTIKRRVNTLYNALRSIYEDTIFVGEISQLWPKLPLLANLRCGLWYSSPSNFHSTCYFKSTDGHNNNWSFSTSRLNLHVAILSGNTGGCMIVDSTRKGKRFPDSMSKTIPIWSCVLNRAVARFRIRKGDSVSVVSMIKDEGSPNNDSNEWDCHLHLPLWVSDLEKAAIEEQLEDWVDQLEASGADVASLSSCLRKPLRPLWISQKTVIWLNEVPDHDSWDFTPLILISASSPNGFEQPRTTSEFSWNYIPGAGDDEESWARGLTPTRFWQHAYDLISSGPELCNQKVADMVERDRVFLSYRCLNTQQKNSRPSEISFNQPSFQEHIQTCTNETDIYWLGSTKVAVGKIQSAAAHLFEVDCLLNCSSEDSIPVELINSKSYLHLPMMSSKIDRLSILKNLPTAVEFAGANLSGGNKLLVCCHSGDDISVCVCLAIISSLFNHQATFDSGSSFNPTNMSKVEMRRRLVNVCKYVPTARPSRGNLKQVFGYLIGTSSPTS